MRFNCFSDKQIYQNKTAVVYHRTRSLSNIEGIIRTRFIPSRSNVYGSGFYATYSIKDQFSPEMGESFGSYLIACKIKNLNRYLILNMDEAKIIHGANWKLSSQIKMFSKSLTEKIRNSKKVTFQKLDRLHQNKKNIIYLLHREFNLDQQGIHGVIFHGEIACGAFGSCLLKYGSIKEGEDFVLLRYAFAPSDQDIKKVKWFNTTSLMSLRSHSIYKNQIVDRQFSLGSKFDLHKIFKDSDDILQTVATINEKKLSIGINSFSEEEISDFFWQGNDTDGAIKLILKYSQKVLSLDEIYGVLMRFSKLNEIDLKHKNLMKLNLFDEIRIHNICNYAKDKIGAISLFKKYKTNLTEKEKDIIKRSECTFRLTP